MTTYHFLKVEFRRTARGKCPTCGKATVRSQTFSQTVNPWNRNPDGAMKTHAEVAAAVREKAAAWVPDFAHAACRGGAS